MTRPTLYPVTSDDNVRTVQNLLRAQGYGDELPSDGVFNGATREAVEVFQLQHIDERGLPLVADGVVGPKTWWALEHPSGDAQRSFLADPPVGALTPLRTRLLDILIAEHALDVREVPDGTNRGEAIDKYFGNTGILGQPWCCAFVCWALHQALGRYPIGGVHHLGVQRMWLAARNANLSTNSPCPGDVFIQIKPGGKGHTGFVVGLSPDGRALFTAEGNTGNRLKFGRRKPNTIDHFIDCLQDGQPQNFERSHHPDLPDLDELGTR